MLARHIPPLNLDLSHTGLASKLNAAQAAGNAATPGYGAPPPAAAAPQQGYGAPQQQQPQYGAPAGGQQYGAPQGQQGMSSHLGVALETTAKGEDTAIDTCEEGRVICRPSGLLQVVKVRGRLRAALFEHPAGTADAEGLLEWHAIAELFAFWNAALSRKAVAVRQHCASPTSIDID